MPTDSQYLTALENQYGLPAGLLAAVAQRESGGKNYVVGAAGEQGPFQIKPATGTDYGATNLFDFRQSATVAAMYLSDLKKQTGSIQGALEAYNYGIGNYLKNSGNVPASVSDYANSILSNSSGRTVIEPGTQPNGIGDMTLYYLDNSPDPGNNGAQNSSGKTGTDSGQQGKGSMAGSGNLLSDFIDWFMSQMGNFTIIVAGLILLALIIWNTLDSKEITIKTQS